MKKLLALLLSVSLVPLSAYADPWKDKGGYGHGKGKYKEEYWEGNCKVKREIKKNGEYKEKRKCKAPEHSYYQAAPVYIPAPPPVVVQPGVHIHGTVTLP